MTDILELGYVEGRAELLEAFYCNTGEHEDDLKEFGLGNSFKSLPRLPSDLGHFRDQTFQVISGPCLDIYFQLLLNFLLNYAPFIN